MIGEYISALSNSAALCERPKAYLVLGVDDATYKIVGTEFQYRKMKKENEELEAWLSRMLSLRINFRFFEVPMDEGMVVLMEILCAEKQPVQFAGGEYIRIGTNKKNLKAYPDKERELWRTFDSTPYELRIAMGNLNEDEMVSLLDYSKYYDKLEMPIPRNRDKVLEDLQHEKFIMKNDAGASLVAIERIVDSVLVSRNENIAGFMHKCGICEERGSGYDKIVEATGKNELLAPRIENQNNQFTKVILFAKVPFELTTKEDRMHICYMQACLAYVNFEGISNSDIRKIFGLGEK